MATVQEKAQIVAWLAEFKSIVTVQRTFQRTYARKSPTAKSIRRWYNQFKQTGSLEKRKSTGRPRKTKTPTTSSGSQKIAHCLKEIPHDTFCKYFHGISKAYVVNHNVILPENTQTIMEKLQTFQARHDDIYVSSYPKAGAELIQEIVHLLLNDVNNEESLGGKRDQVIPHMDRLGMFNVPDSFYDPLEILETKPFPRLIKTHLPYSLIPPTATQKKCKIIYLARNIRDIIISYFHFAQSIDLLGFEGSFSDFFELFLNGYVPYGSYLSHVKSFWNVRNQSNILFLTYEEMRKDLPSVIKTIADFLGKNVTEENLEKIIDYCSLEKLKHNFRECLAAQSIQHGIVGEWKEGYSAEQKEKIINFLKDEVKDSGLRNTLDNDLSIH